ncbi:MAG TPA: NrfD/PsrC family molybdoenzyme membrane anchor subunit [Bacillus sp. (in: firmicutes)]|nr:NrfD/PsrC family molybdoenzyme membrane anchor subunit [Bacillus sp. (in: firmicutes)]
MANGNLILDVQHQIPFGMMIVFYIFIAGMAAGLFIFSSLGPVFGMKKMQPLAKPASVMALAAVIPGVIALIVDLGQPLRFFKLMYRFNPSSAMSWGTYILTIFSLITMGYIYFLWKGDTRRIKRVGIAGLVAAVSLGLYTGFLIALAPAHPLWNSALVPVLFLVSGLVSGLSMISVGAIFFPKLTGLSSDSADEMMHKMKGWFIALELVLLVSHLMALFISDAGRAVFHHLVTGDKMFSFVILQIGMGMVLPIVLLLVSKSKAMMGISSILSLIGVFALRYNMIIGGQELPRTGQMMRTLEGGWGATVIFLVLSVILLIFLPTIVNKVINKFLSPSSSGRDTQKHAV